MQRESSIADPSADVKVRNVDSSKGEEDSCSEKRVHGFFETSEFVKCSLGWVLCQLSTLTYKCTTNARSDEYNKRNSPHRPAEADAHQEAACEDWINNTSNGCARSCESDG